MDFSLFNLTEYLDDKQIPYVEQGKNLSSNWIGIQCPFCDDESNHFGINKDSKAYSCWRCGEKGTLSKLLMKIEKCSFEKSKKIIAKYSNIDPNYIVSSSPALPCAHKVDFPIESQALLNTAVTNYLKKRNFDPEKISQEYKIRDGGILGNWRFRIIIPVFYKNQLVTFTSRDITDQSEQRYKNLPNDQSIIPIKQTLYNLDTVRDRVAIVEGPTDVWRMGKGFVATYGTQYTFSQVKLLRKMKQAFIMYDPEAIEEGGKLAHDLSSFIYDVQIVTLKKSDPGEMKENDVKHLRKQIFQQYY